MIRGPFTPRHYPNLPAQQHGVQRIADEFNAAEREWERTHPAKPRRKSRRNGRKAAGTVATGKVQPVKHGIGFAST